MGIPDHLTCLLRNMYAGQEAILMGWFQIEKGVKSQMYIVTLLI